MTQRRRPTKDLVGLVHWSLPLHILEAEVLLSELIQNDTYSFHTLKIIIIKNNFLYYSISISPFSN